MDSLRKLPQNNLARSLKIFLRQSQILYISTRRRQVAPYLLAFARFPAGSGSPSLSSTEDSNLLRACNEASV
jgi:hypothetical protein